MKRKISVSATEVVELVRMGATNQDLGRRYGLSPRGVRRLFDKLVAAGELNEDEVGVQRRSLRKADAVTVAHTIFPSRKKKTINGKNAAHDIRCGLSDFDMMEKYGLTAKGLASLYQKLTRAGVVEQSELDERHHAYQWVAQAFPKVSKAAISAPEPQPVEILPQAEAPGFLKRNQAKLLASLTIVAGCLLLAACVIVGSIGVRVVKAMAFHKTAPLAENMRQKNDDDIERSIEALKSMTQPSTATSEDNSFSQSEEYRDCLKSCDDDNSGSGAEESALRGNCRRECVIQYQPAVETDSGNLLQMTCRMMGDALIPCFVNSMWVIDHPVQ